MSTITEHRGCNSAALLIHTAFFAYQKSHGRMVGTSSGAILKLAVPYLSKMIYLAGLPDLRKEKGLKDNMSNYISMVKESGYVVDAKFLQTGDNTYSFEMKQCHFAFKGHRIFNEGGLICPFALLASAILSIETESPISIEESKLSDTGSLTMITVQR